MPALPKIDTQRDLGLGTLSWLSFGLILTAVIVAGAAMLPLTQAALGFVALALLIAAVLCWRLSLRIAASIDDSHAWSEVASLQTSLARRDAIWAALPAPIAAWDADGQLLSATGLWTQLGLSHAAPPDSPELVIGDPPRVFTVESAVRPDGTRLVVLREVTRERQALQAKDELLAIVSHELRTPLSSIKGYSQLMVRQLGTVQEQVQRLDRLIGDVLDTVGADSGRLRLKREPLSVGDLVSAAAERFRAAHPERKLERHVDDGALIEGDAQRLAQILDNLLSNAAKYSPPDTCITIRSHRDGDWVRIAVVDAGRGIAAEHLPHVFERFYRAPVEDARAPAGFGLGLSIVRDLVEAHGGRVEVDSRGAGNGSTFTVVLPVALAIEAAR